MLAEKEAPSWKTHKRLLIFFFFKRKTAYEILLSESQERMLIIARRGKEDVVRAIFEKWDVPCVEIGRVADDGMMRVRNNGEISAEIPAKALADEAPLYSREAKEPVATRLWRVGKGRPIGPWIQDLAKIDNLEALR